jgi:TonB family protein
MKIANWNTRQSCLLLLVTFMTFTGMACSKGGETNNAKLSTPGNTPATAKPTEPAANKAAPVAGKEIKPADGPKLKSIEPTEGTILGGVLNSYATSLPQPDPAAAKEANVSGTVTVEIVIDEKGKVVASSVVSGPKELWRAAGNAAREAKFDPPLHDGKPVKVAGVLTYEFTK